MAKQPNLLIPVNRLTKTKGRLQTFLSEEERIHLTISTLKTVIEASNKAGFITAILTDDKDVVSLASALIVIQEKQELKGLNEQINSALNEMAKDEIVIVHADLPLITAKSLIQLKKASLQTNSIVIAKSFDGGSNAILLKPPKYFSAEYGPGSCAKHHNSAITAGLSATVIDPPELYLDLDTPKDLQKLLATEIGRKSPAGKYLIKIDAIKRLKEANFLDVRGEV